MLFNSKGKLFGKVSIVDILVIILIVVAIAGAYVRFNGNNVGAVTKTTEFNYMITIREIRETNKNLLLDSVGTDFRLDGKISSSMGTLTNVEVRDAIAEVEKTDGTIVSAAVPEKYDVVLTLKVNGTETDTGYFTPEMYEVCAGKEITLTNIKCNVTGYIDKVWK
ncbi:MAG: DUF4330 family protein [Clostridia bacterium]|nr:DUF4330 family protein [Clostridia bacterium]